MLKDKKGSKAAEKPVKAEGDGIKKEKKGKKRPAESQGSEKVEWKKFKKQKQDLKVKRKTANNPLFDVGNRSKKIWEELRRDDCHKAKREKLCEELYGLVKGQVKSLAFAHDTVRVLECLISKASAEIVNSVFSEIEGCILDLSKSAYGHFIVKKMLSVGTKEQKSIVMKSFLGKVVTLMKHKIASEVVESAYNEWANSKQRALMRQEFYSSKYVLLRDEEIRGLGDAIAKVPTEKVHMLKHLREGIQNIIDKDIGSLQPSIFHTLILEYLTHCSENERTDMIQLLREKLASFVHSHDGSRVAMTCLWHGTAKDRKVIVKSFKGHVAKICMEEHGHLVLLALFDSVDDTVLVSKAIVNEIVAQMKEIAVHSHGRKVILYLVARRHSKYFHPDIINILKQGDGNSASKKDAAVRQKELLAAVSDTVLTVIADDISSWVNSNAIIVVTEAILKNCSGEKKLDALKALATWISQPFVPGKGDNPVENTACHYLLRNIIASEKEAGSTAFVSFLVDALSPSVLDSWIQCNRGCFSLATIWDTDIAVQEKLAGRLKTCDIGSQHSKGAEVLKKKMGEAQTST